MSSSCISYYSEKPFETREECNRAVNSVIQTEEIQAMLVLPEYDLELTSAGCVEEEYFE